MNKKTIDLIKVYFPGEPMWVKIVNIDSDSKHALGKIDNYPVNSRQHNYSFNDEVECHQIEWCPGEFCWEPVYKVNPNRADGPISKYTPDDIWYNEANDDNY